MDKCQRGTWTKCDFQGQMVPAQKNGMVTFEPINFYVDIINTWKAKKTLQYDRWPWHGLFWTGYCLFRFWVYYITVKYYDPVFLEYMLWSELFFIIAVYLTLFLYRRFFLPRKYRSYFAAGLVLWMLYLYGRTVFQFWYLQAVPAFKSNSFADIFFNNITVVIVYFLFLTACKYFKDGYIAQQYEAERKEQQLLAEVSNLKSQVAPHFLFNTLNNLYGLSVEKSDKLPGLMLRLSDLLRHSLYETQKPYVPVYQEIKMLKSYVELERIRLEDDLRLSFEDSVPADAGNPITPLLLVVFVENAFKHGRLVQGQPVDIAIRTSMENNLFTLQVKNRYNPVNQPASPAQGIGLTNVKRRLEVLYPHKHELSIQEDGVFYIVTLQLQLDATTI